MISKVVSVFFTLAIVGCATTATAPAPTLQGNSSADIQAKNNAYMALQKIALKDLNCSSIDQISVVTSKPLMLEKYKDPISVNDVWNAKGCGRSISYDVIFIPDMFGKQGTWAFSIQKL